MFTTWPRFYVIACSVEVAAVVATWDGTRSSDHGGFCKGRSRGEWLWDGMAVKLGPMHKSFSKNFCNQMVFETKINKQEDQKTCTFNEGQNIVYWNNLSERVLRQSAADKATTTTLR